MNLLFSQPWVVRLGWALLHFLWQGTLIAVAFAVIRALLARSLSAHARYLLACATLGTMTIAPVLTYFAAATAAPVSWQVIPSFAWVQALPWLVLAWLGGVAVFSARLIGGWRLASRMRSASVRPAPAEWQQMLEGLIARMGSSKPVRLLTSSLVEVPTVIGWLTPVILMPVGALAGLPPEHISALLAHELAHIRRHDYLANILQSIAEAVLFYHPAVWWVSDQIRAERELCCDDLAVAVSGGDVLTYARALAEVESFRPAHAGTVLAANGGSLSSRIRRLIGQTPSVSQSLPSPGAVLSLALLWLVGIGAVTMHGSTLEPAAQPPPPPSPAVPTIALQPPVLLPTPVLSALLFDPFFEPPQVPAPAPAASSSISGHVTNSATGAGIGGARVRLSIGGQPGAALPQEGVTDDTGAFRIAGISDGQYLIMLFKSGYFGPDIAGPSPKVRVFGDTRYDLQMTPPAGVRGRVLDPDGKPAAGIAVKASSRIDMSITDENGEFVIKEVPPLIRFTLSATPKPQTDGGAKDEERIVTTYYPSVIDSSQAARIQVQGVDLFGYDIRLQTAPARRIRGVVLDVDGKPAARARVTVSKPALGMITRVIAGRGTVTGDPQSATAESAETNEDGAFAFPPVPKATGT